MRVVGTRNFRCRRAASGGVADNSDTGTIEPNKSIDVLNSNSDALQEGSSGRISGSTGGSTAYVSWGGGWSVVAASGDRHTSNRDQLGMRIVGAGNLGFGGAAGGRVPDDSNVGTCQTDKGVNILNSDSKALDEESRSWIRSSGGTSAAYVSGGSGWSVVATSGHRNTSNRDQFGMGIVGARNFRCGRAASGRVADYSNIGACETNKGINILSRNSEALDEQSRSWIRSGGDRFTAYIARRRGTTGRCGSRKGSKSYVGNEELREHC